MSTAMVGRSRRYGGSAWRTLATNPRSRRRAEEAAPISAAEAAARGATFIARRSPSCGSTVEDLRDLPTRGLRGRLNRGPAGRNASEHVLKHLGVLDVRPVRSRRHEPTG